MDQVDADRRIRLKDHFFQLDRYSGKVPPGLKIGEDTSMVVDLFDRDILESYFFDPGRERELRTATFRILDKLYSKVQASESPSLLLYDFNHLPKGSYKFYSREQFLSHLEERGLGKVDTTPATAQPPQKKKQR